MYAGNMIAILLLLFLQEKKLAQSLVPTPNYLFFRNEKALDGALIEQQRLRTVFKIDKGTGQTIELPIDKKAIKETVNLYNNLKKLLKRGIMFGHQDALAYGVGWKYEKGRSDVKDVTGDYPAVYGWELGHLEIDHAVNLDSVPFNKMKGFIREAYDRGGVITLSWHLRNPLTGKTAWDAAPGTVASILPGGEKNNLYKSWL